jgi:membrane-bound lytic murein transglycosylase D
MIESGHNPTITSPVGAAGLWQFMAPSARMYGLTVDRWVDERRDPARATAAAVQLLGDLYQRFGNWELTMAAYNMGYAGLSRAIAKFNTNDYWTLSRLEGGIPWETTLYVPKIFALAIVMNNRDAFGLGRIVPDPAVSFDTILVAPATELDAIARAAGTTREVLAELNPAFLTDRLPPPLGEPHALPVRVPSGRGEAAKRVHASVDATRRTIVVRQGDDLSTLALDYGGAEAEWARVNDLGKMERLEPGTVLLAPAHAKQEAAAPAPAAVVVGRLLSPAKSERLVFYEVRPGDDLERIAEAFGVASRALGNWNSLDPAARLREGMTLQALVDRNQDLSRVRHRDARGTRVLVAGSPEFHEHFESLRGMHRVEVVVRAGDTLGSIGNRHGMSVGSMERVNRRSRSTKLVPGEVLIVYTDKPGAGPGGDAGAAPLEDIDPPRPELLPSAAAALP